MKTLLKINSKRWFWAFKVASDGHKSDFLRGILHRILSIWSGIWSSAYKARLFQAVFSLAWRGIFMHGWGFDSSKYEQCMFYKSCFKQEWCLNLQEICRNSFGSSKNDQFGRGLTIHIPA